MKILYRIILLLSLVILFSGCTNTEYILTHTSNNQYIIDDVQSNGEMCLYKLVVKGVNTDNCIWLDGGICIQTEINFEDKCGKFFIGQVVYFAPIIVNP